MTKPERAAEITRRLENKYPKAVCSLDYGKDYELLISVRLAAQCTDARVNIVTQDLFKKYPTLGSFAEADLEELRAGVKSCGFYKVKGADIKNMCRILIDCHGGRVPDTMEALLALPGVGRKTANLILGDIYGVPAVVADTHCIRISNRLGLAVSPDPYKVELALKEVLDPAKSNDFCHRLVLFGREICQARKPKCAQCPLFDACERRGV